METDTDRGSFGPVLRRLRRAAGMSQEELAERAHLSVESIGALERGRRRAPYRETIRLIADALELSDAGRQELQAAAKPARLAAPKSTSYDSADGAAPGTGGSFQRDNSRQNLIHPVSSFHNRRRELDDLARLLAEHRLVSIVGAGGIGKTRVAIELGWNVLPRYRDGVWFIDLAPLGDRSSVARSFISTLAIPQADGQSELEALLHHLERRDALLVIDNCEHVVEQVASVTDTLLPSCPNLRVLATSREPLHVSGERVYRMPPLQSPSAAHRVSAQESLGFAAVALFVDRSTAANAAFRYTDAHAGAVAETCRRLDGIALAIELAASRTAVMNPQQILAQLEDHFRILTGGSRTALPRQQTMRETIRWSYDRLNTAEQSLFRQIAIFANGFTWDSVARLAQTVSGSPDAPLDDLTSLVDKSLVVVEASESGSRYRLLEPMRAFGIEMLAQAGELADMQRRFAAWCVAFTRAAHEAWATVPSAVWSAQVEPELDNVRACLFWTLDARNDIELGQRIVGMTRRLWGRLFPSEGKRWTVGARGLVSADTPRDVAASLALADAHVRIALHEFSSALNAAQDFETLAGAAPDELEIAEARGFAGFALAHLGRAEDGERLMAQSVDVYRARGAKQLAAHGVNDLAIAYLIRGDLLGARQFFREALVMFEAVGNARGAGSVTANLAETEYRAGDVLAAVRLCRDALATASNGRADRIFLANMAAYLIALGRFDEARVTARESIFWGGMARADVEIAIALQHLGAIAVYRQAAGGAASAEELSAAARLVGFVDARLGAYEIARQYTEQHEYDMLVEMLRSQLGTQTFEALCNDGRLWSEDAALEAALRI